MCMASNLSIKFFGFDSDELLKTLEPFFSRDSINFKNSIHWTVNMFMRVLIG